MTIYYVDMAELGRRVLKSCQWQVFSQSMNKVYFVRRPPVGCRTINYVLFSFCRIRLQKQTKIYYVDMAELADAQD